MVRFADDAACGMREDLRARKMQRSTPETAYEVRLVFFGRQ